MTVEESVHYGIAAPEAHLEWLSFTALIGDGSVRLGHSHRVFFVSIIHQLHCLRSIWDAMGQGWMNMDEHARGHTHHCFNYLRDRILCQADTTLEPGEFTALNLSWRRSSGIKTCADWKPIFDYVWDNWVEWNVFREKNGIYQSQG